MIRQNDLSASSSASFCKPLGVSVVICCHNSSRRLPETLGHLARQRQLSAIPWEVIVVDNASTDNTAIVAADCWRGNGAAPLRIISEPKLGLTYARECGFRESRYEFISFVDDDNWVCPDWVCTVFETMSTYPDIGVCGGINYAVCEISPPHWFEKFKTMFAITPTPAAIGDVSSDGCLSGAGMTVRSSAWQSVVATGYRWSVVDRQGKALTGCGDWEICLAIRLKGWRLWRDPRLHLQHFLPAGRLNWRYVRRLHRGHGRSSVQLDGYYFLQSDQSASWKKPLRKMWQWHMLASIALLLRHPWRLLTFWRACEGDSRILEIEVHFGRISGFLCSRDSYKDGCQQVRESLLGALSGIRPATAGGSSHRS